MITIKKAETKEIDQLYTCCGSYLSTSRETSSNDNYEYIVVIDKKSILGFCEMIVKSTCFYEITSIYIKEEEQNHGLGDGVLRASLNYMRNSGYNYAVLKGHLHLYNFLKKEGIPLLKDATVPHDMIEILQQYDFTKDFFCDINMFFKGGCKHK